MKIALVASEGNKTAKWSTPIGLSKAFSKKGHDVDNYYLNAKQCDFSKIEENSDGYDLIFFCWCGPSPSFDENLKKLKSKTETPVYLELGDEPQTYTHNQQRINHVDAFFTPDLRCHMHYRGRNLPSHWMTHWCDDEIFYKTNTERENICVTTCIGERPLLHMFSRSYGGKFINKKVSDYENTEFYNSGTITYQFARFDEITRRIFEAGGCGNAIITNRISPDTGIYDLFKEDEDICYFSNEGEAIEKMRKLYNDDDYRNHLANNIYKKIKEKHLVGNRIDQILEVLEG
tara:strand:+ start:172 stop:1038 length:867 start_codon:yes stop_codon:yes gene_type:complete